MLPIYDVHFPCGRALPWVVLGWRLLATDAHAREVPQSWSLVTGCIWALVPMVGVTCLQAPLTEASAWITTTYPTRPSGVVGFRVGVFGCWGWGFEVWVLRLGFWGWGLGKSVSVLGERSQS